MNDQQFDYEALIENDPIHILDSEFQNTMQILIAESIGSIPKNYFVDHFIFFNR